MGDNNKESWDILNIFFRDNPNFLVNHHLQSYNDFFDNGLSQLLKEKNPIHFFKNQEKMSINYETKYIDDLNKGEIKKPITFEEMKDFYPNKTEEELDKIWKNCRNDGNIKTKSMTKLAVFR